jgi:Zn-finger nucleic acid-binding protein
MKCPRCDGLLDERERQGVTVDVCPGCRGVWLDRGELEKMLAYAKRELEEERAYYNAPPTAPPRDYPPGAPARDYPPAPRDYDREPPSSDDRRRARHGHPHAGHGYRKKSWLENLGDIFD